MIIHLDADAFFASVAQAINPRLKGKPVISGAERGIATSISYEARKFGVKRGMRTSEIKKICPQCIIANSDYALYDIFSQKMFRILRSFTPEVDEYSIDEAFADLAGLTPWKQNIHEAKYVNFYSATCANKFMDNSNFFALGGLPHTEWYRGNKNWHVSDSEYLILGQAIKQKIESSLGITISIGISLTKSLAKLASNFQKPSGLTIINKASINNFLEKIPVRDIWGIGPQTSTRLNYLGIHTAFEFIQKPEEFIRHYLTKPYLEIWQELQGIKIYELNTAPKNTYHSITKSQTFYPPTNNFDILWSRFTTHIESTFTKARCFNYSISKIFIFLKTQNFKYYTTEIKINSGVSYPFLIRKELKNAFLKIYKPGILYRTTGCTITDLADINNEQTTLFTDQIFEQKVKNIYPLLEKRKIDFGSSLYDKKISKKLVKNLKIPFIGSIGQI